MFGGDCKQGDACAYAHEEKGKIGPTPKNFNWARYEAQHSGAADAAYTANGGGPEQSHISSERSRQRTSFSHAKYRTPWGVRNGLLLQQPADLSPRSRIRALARTDQYAPVRQRSPSQYAESERQIKPYQSTCFFWKQFGHCELGSSCDYNHHNTGRVQDPPGKWKVWGAEHGRPTQSIPPNIREDRNAPVGLPPFDPKREAQRQKDSIEKRRINTVPMEQILLENRKSFVCFFWRTFGNCRWSENCEFKHGDYDTGVIAAPVNGWHTEGQGEYGRPARLASVSQAYRYPRGGYDGAVEVLVEEERGKNVKANDTSTTTNTATSGQVNAARIRQTVERISRRSEREADVIDLTAVSDSSEPSVRIKNKRSPAKPVKHQQKYAPNDDEFIPVDDLIGKPKAPASAEVEAPAAEQTQAVAQLVPSRNVYGKRSVAQSRAKLGQYRKGVTELGKKVEGIKARLAGKDE